MHPVPIKIEFDGEIWKWQGPAPWHFVSVPPEQSRELKALSNSVTYGWGMIPVQVRIGKSTWKTSLWPKDDFYIVPIKAAIRKAEKIDVGGMVTIQLELR